jgi:hypothetical protein
MTIWRRHWIAVVLIALAIVPNVRSQNGIGDVVYTVGTVAHDSHGQDWAYLLWQATQPNLLSNRVFAVYAKPGDPTNTAPYARVSIVTVQSDARVIEPLLRRAENLGDDLNKLQQDLQQLFGSFMPSNAISRADQLSAVIRGSLNDSRYYQNLMLLARNHAGINLALGFADAELIPPGRTTFEVRAFDAAASKDLAVIGRVTVQAGAPTILPPPGPPVLIPEASAMGDLNLKFRWGTPDNLRRLGLMQFGYNLYRVASGFAAANGWNDTNPPPITVLTNVIATNSYAARRINRVPITPAKLFNLADAANITPPTGDTNTSFIRDDDGRGRPGYINFGFTNGATYYYYAAARDVLGRDGALSFGLLATVCDRLPPLPPLGVHVLNDYQYDPISKTSTQALRVVWKQNFQTNDIVTNYWVYRWTNLVEMNSYSGNPSNNLIGIVPQIPNVTNNSFLDIGPSSPTAPSAYGETFWYTVRAGDLGACGQNLSGPGGPAFGVLRDRIGPAAGSGTVEINCVQPVVNIFSINSFPLTAGPDLNNYDVFLNCTRLDSRFDWAEFYGVIQYSGVGGGSTTISNFLGRFYFGGPAVSVWWTPPRSNDQSTVTMQVACRAALNNGKISSFTTATVMPPPTSAYADVEFQALTVNVRTIAGGPNQGDCLQHDPGGGGLSGTNNIIISVFPTPTSKEYRIYRRVDSGPLSLLCQGAVTNILSIIKCFENAPPVNGGTICFYFQLLDENGNPSPMTPITPCIDTAPSAPLPVPVLSKIVSSGDSSTAGMNLSWFCAPYGVERFELRVAALPTQPNTNTPPSTNTPLFSTSLSCTGAPPVSMTFTNFGTNLTLPFFSYVTPKVGPGFGNNGAVFQVPCNVEAGKTYVAVVRALGKGNSFGGFSLFETFVWTPTNAVGPQVPWPARGLPATNSSFTAMAAYLSSTNISPMFQSGSPSGNGVLVGMGNVGPTEVNVFQTPASVTTAFNPNAALQTNQMGQTIFPCAMYRYQVPNANFPGVSGDAIQVSPLMEQIAYQQTKAGTTTTTTFQDPFIAVSATSNGGTHFAWLWLRDTQPQISGARYQYVLVHFNGVHEIDQLIPSNTVEVP